MAASYYAKSAGSTSKPAPVYSPEKACKFSIKVDFADLRDSNGNAYTSGATSADSVYVAYLPAGSVLFSLAVYVKKGEGTATFDLTDGTTTFINNGTAATDDTWDLPDTNPMAAVNYDADTGLYLTVSETCDSAVIIVSGAYYMAVDDTELTA